MALLQPVNPDKTPIPPLGAGKNAQPEDKLWRELVLALEKRPIPDPTWPKRCSVHAYDEPSSRNWPPLSAATWYAAEPDREIDGRTAAQWWRDWSGWQLGGKSGPHRVRDTATAEAWWKQWNDDPVRRDSGPAALRIFGSDEVLSNTYDGMTIGAALAVLATSRQRGDTVTAAAVSAFLAVWVAATALASAAPSTAVHVHGLDGRGAPKIPQGLNLPAVVGIGARSTPNHAVADPRALLLAEMIEWPGARHPWPARDPWKFWFLQNAARCNGDFGLSPELTADARAVIQNNDVEAMDRLAADLAGTNWAGFEIRRWSDLVVGIMPECRNHNTAWVPASAARPNGLIELWFPWPKAKPGNLSSGRAEVDESGKLRVTSGFVKPAQPLPELQLPAEPPLRHWLFASDGFRLAGAQTPPGGTGTTGEPGGGEPPGGGPGGETPSVESRLAALEEQVRALQEAVAALQREG